MVKNESELILTNFLVILITKTINLIILLKF